MNSYKSSDKKRAVKCRLEALDLFCAGNRVTPLLNPPGQHESTIYRGEDDHELTISYDVEYEPAQNGGWDDPSWGESATAYGAYFQREKNGLWYPIDLTKSEAESLGEKYIKDCREADDDYDAQDRYDVDDRYDDRYDY